MRLKALGRAHSRKRDRLSTMYDTAQTDRVTRRYSLRTMRLLRDLILVLCSSPGRTCEESGLMLARVRPSGIFELLSAAAWARALGYTPDELVGKAFSELMSLEKPAAGQVVAALLDRKDCRALDVTLRCKDEQRKCFRLHRRFDAYQETMYLVADELPGDRIAPRRSYG
jgi:PAS domain-containing protein